MNSTEKLRLIFSKHLPQNSIPYCLDLWIKNGFNFTVTPTRKTKLGDFRWRRDSSRQTITINGTLNPYQFLITYIHEVAHLHTYLHYGVETAPHGKEWKITFQKLMSPLLKVEIFPKDILIPLSRHMRNPKASSAGDLFLNKELSKYDLNHHVSEEVFLADLKPGLQFELQGRKFKKKETRRTRVLCEEIPSGKKFLISQLAKIKPLED
ncbi:SprT-like domain-containing protein [Algoriphagus hitonicola]|uniref:SprT-like family protein n=1 Tax=Algoriphagus hitonicola TaxID=435880 RepID=A0A1I2XVU8_9BACT|nr:SprT-like domain-containing protein [Algoriphagus hitonicola]SFH17593.1 SprT-like family protein [Algoriphagus hitonicola]